MNRLYQKIPFLLELFFNGTFIFLYAFHISNKIKMPLFSFELMNTSLKVLSVLAPFIILLGLIIKFKRASSIDEFFRKNALSLLIFFPLLIVAGDMEFVFWFICIHLFSSVLSLYERDKVEELSYVAKAKISRLNIIERIKLKPAQMILFTFATIILVGTFLLSLPIVTISGESLPLIDAFFMATSATCVTGLTSVSILDNFNIVGQLVIVLLVQIGGLGYMTLYSSLTILLGKSLALKDQVLMQDVLDISSFEGLINMIIDIIKITVTIEFWGAVILGIGFFNEGRDIGESIYFGFFHSIMAFCNSGFSLFQNNLEEFSGSPIITFTIMALITTGGIGFIVIKELAHFIKKRKKMVDLSVHTKVVLLTSSILIIVPALYIFFFEFTHGIDRFSLSQKIQVSLFQSVTLRTAGFSTMLYNDFYLHSLYLFILCMFIGGSPGSTAGGIKTTTFAILFRSVLTTLKGKEEVSLFDRHISHPVIIKSVAIIVISMFTISIALIFLLYFEPDESFLSLVFEAVSAFSTTGASLGITPFLSMGSKVVIIFLMYIGRVGPLTFVLALGQTNEDSGSKKFPEGRLMIG